MSKHTYINAESVDGTVTIRSGGKGLDVLMLSAEVFCSTLYSKLKKDCPDSDRLEIAHDLIDETMERLKTEPVTTIALPRDFLTEK
nr:MAG TPA: hypothetical protein [Caudoviricetes sp.]